MDTMADKKSNFYDQISEEDKRWIELFDLQPKEEVTCSRHFMRNMNRHFQKMRKEQADSFSGGR